LIQWWWTILPPALQPAVITHLSPATFTNDGQNHRWRGFWNWWWWTLCSTTIALPILLRNRKENKVVEPWSQLPFGHLSLTICINFFSINNLGIWQNLLYYYQLERLQFSRQVKLWYKF
jgi:hypothetical protein